MEPKEIQETAMSWPDRARTLAVITGAASYQAAADALIDIKTDRARIDAICGPEIRKRWEAHREAVAERNKADEPLIEAEGILKDAMKVYQREHDRIAAERERAEWARLERQAELEREAEIVEAEADGASAAEVAEIAARPLEVPAMVRPALRAAKPSGISMRDNWKAEVVDLLKLVRYCGSNPHHVNLVQPNLTALGQQAKSLKSATNIPGVRVYNEPVVAAGRR